jgi:hypothetical protein
MAAELVFRSGTEGELADPKPAMAQTVSSSNLNNFCAGWGSWWSPEVTILSGQHDQAVLVPQGYVDGPVHDEVIIPGFLSRGQQRNQEEHHEHKCTDSLSHFADLPPDVRTLSPQFLAALK